MSEANRTTKRSGVVKVSVMNERNIVDVNNRKALDIINV